MKGVIDWGETRRAISHGRCVLAVPRRSLTRSRSHDREIAFFLRMSLWAAALIRDGSGPVMKTCLWRHHASSDRVVDSASSVGCHTSKLTSVPHHFTTLLQLSIDTHRDDVDIQIFHLLSHSHSDSHSRNARGSPFLPPARHCSRGRRP